MAKKLNSVLGVDIGSHKIKLAEVRSQGRDAVVTSLGMIDTPEGAVDHTGVFNPDAVGHALKQLIAQSGVTVGDVVVTIAGQASVLVRTLEVPRMNPTELKEHMQWEINRNIPFAESTVVSDYKPLADEDPNSQNMDVVLAIAPQSAIDTVISCIKKAGRKVFAIDVQPLGIARSLMRSYDDRIQGQTVCVIDVGHKTTAINIYRNGKLLMPRQVPLGGEMFSRAIADNLVISLSEAEEMKLHKAGIPEEAINAASAPAANPFGATDVFTAYNPFAEDPTTATQPPAYEDVPAAPEATPPASAAPVPQANPELVRIYNSFAAVLDEFLAEIRRSVDYFRSRGGDINEMYLCGGGSQLKGLTDYLSAALGIPCDAYDPLRRLNQNIRKVSPQFVEEHRQSFTVAVGNGLHIFFD
jgi:type IV pilus assembly protein PilM